MDLAVVLVCPGGVRVYAPDAGVDFPGTTLLTRVVQAVDDRCDLPGPDAEVLRQVVQHLSTVVGRGRAPAAGPARRLNGVTDVLAVTKADLAQEHARLTGDGVAVTAVRPHLPSPDVQLRGGVDGRHCRLGMLFTGRLNGCFFDRLRFFICETEIGIPAERRETVREAVIEVITEPVYDRGYVATQVVLRLSSDRHRLELRRGLGSCGPAEVPVRHQVLEHAFPAALPAVAALAVPAEPGGCVEHVGGVHPDDAGAHAAGDLKRQVQVLAPHRGSQAVTGVVGQFDGFFLGAERGGDQNRPKDLDLRYVRGRVDVGEQRGREVQALFRQAQVRLVTGGAFLPALFDQTADPLQLDRGDQGTDVD